MDWQIDLDLDPTAPPYVASATFGGVQRRLQIRYNRRAAQWAIDLLDTDGSAIIAGQPLIESFPLFSRHKATDSRVPSGDLWRVGSALVYVAPES